MQFTYLSVILFAFSNVNGNIVNICLTKLDKGLTFIEQRYKEFNFDGLFGVTLAQAQLLKSLECQLEEDLNKKVSNLISKCQSIHEKMLPLLPDNPPYMVTFRRKLLDARVWSKIPKNHYISGRISDGGIYKNWTAEIVLQHKAAVFKGIKSDKCLREILENSEPGKQCFVSQICEEMMLDKFRNDTGYLLTHRLLYIFISTLQGCLIEDPFWTRTDYMTHLCSLAYREAKTSEHLEYPYHDLFMEQVFFCGLEGFEEFLQENWLKEVLRWQNPYGCYQNTSVSFSKTKRTSNVIDFGCSDHTTGLGIATISLYLNYLLHINYES